VEQFEVIRRDSRDRGMSIRALAERHGVHRRTVRQALADATPPARKVPERLAPATGQYVDLVRRWLIDDLSTPRKQRHTARRIWQRLVEEEDARIGESTVRNLVARLRLEIGADRCRVMVPQTHPAAAEAEVDFGEFAASIAGQMIKLYMFCMRLSHSGKAFHIGYANQTQESFLDGHVRAFEAFGGVPGMIRYDNLKPAVIRIALGRERFEHPRFVAMRSHYGYDSFFCVPGIDGAHEKGGVEGEIGRFRRRHLTPIPHVGSLAALNAALAAADARDDARRIGGRAETVGEAAARELPLLTPLPAERFDVALRLSCRVDAKARICVRQSYYSVPARYAGRRLEVRLGATSLTVYDGATVIAQHARSLHKYSEDLILDHYLEVMCRKPGALAGSTALAAARAAGAFTADHQRFWETARRRLGDGVGTRALIGVLLLHRTLSAEAVIAGIRAALNLESCDPDLVAVEARRASHPEPAPPLITPAGQAVGDRPAPSLDGYDQLLAGALA
jgi:transposase